MSVSKTSGPVENFTISFDQGGSTCTMKLSWEETQASRGIQGKEHRLTVTTLRALNEKK